ncbi:PAS domain-containing protein [Pseudoxanthobacter sp.]|uniref:PAS domain-containing protein n=1 Tax=Pseudoxanthobacter sp. TaxID=1925742 RepID=UPI002FE3EB91
MDGADLVFRHVRSDPDAMDASDDLMVDIIGIDGRVLWANAEEADCLGMSPDMVVGLPVDSLYAPASADLIRDLLHVRQNGRVPQTVELELIGRGGRAISTLARLRYLAFEDQIALRLTKMDYGAVGMHHAELAADERLLRNIVSDATEAHWGIVFIEPVDVTQPREEVIRQVFENQSVWQMCNRAMAALYDLPDEIDFNTQSVRLYWPRSEANERFVGQIIDSNYAIDSALSIDHRHDGTPLYLRNDVRAEISDGFLLRLWGNCRDITEQTEAASSSADRVESMQRVFDAIPDPVVVMARSGRLVCRNRAFADEFGGRDGLEAALRRHVAQCVPQQGPARKGWRAVELTAGDGARSLVDVHWREVDGAANETWDVLVVRRRAAPGRPRPFASARRPAP